MGEKLDDVEAQLQAEYPILPETYEQAGSLICRRALEVEQEYREMAKGYPHLHWIDIQLEGLNAIEETVRELYAFFHIEDLPRTGNWTTERDERLFQHLVRDAFQPKKKF